MAVDPLNFADLSPTEFESLCYDLLGDMGYSDISWRRGTGKENSPADGGRDIECRFGLAGPDGTPYYESWLVECKHHAVGVPAAALSGILTAAEATRPQNVLVICSGFLSNPAKDHIEKYKTRAAPSFRIWIWERPKLTELLASRSRLVVKYGLGGDLSFLDQIHPGHALYIRGAQMNTMEYLWGVLDALPPARRDECLGNVYMMVIGPKFRRPRNPRETMAELLVNRIDYPTFKERCSSLGVEGTFLARAIVSYTLDHLFSMADQTRTDYVRENFVRARDYFRRQLEISSDVESSESLRRNIAMVEESVSALPERMKAARRRYEFFCEEVVLPLFAEVLPLPQSEDDLDWVD